MFAMRKDDTQSIACDSSVAAKDDPTALLHTSAMLCVFLLRCPSRTQFQLECGCVLLKFLSTLFVTDRCRPEQ